MAWNTILDIRHDCRECSHYRIMSPNDLHRKEQVLEKLNELQAFFEKKISQFSGNANPAVESVLVTRQNKELCQKLILDCRQCNRLADLVNKEIVLLR